MNRQIPFADFESDQTRFDFIFLNDVFEHVNNPVQILELLKGKLNEDGQLFIDTPKQFWLYPILKALFPTLYRKLLKGTVSKGHLQIWSRKSFIYAITQAGFRVVKYKEVSEYTMPPSYYLNKMGIKNPILKLCGMLFYRNACWLAKNKIMCIVKTARL